MKTRIVQRAALLAAGLTLATQPVRGVSLFSTSQTYLGSGVFHGPGAYMEEDPLFPVVIRNMVWVSEKDFVTPFFNNGAAEPNTAGETDFHRDDPARSRLNAVDGRLSNGALINENVDIYPSRVAGLETLFVVVDGGPHNGRQVSLTSADGEIVMTMDLALDMGIGSRGVVRLPFYGTTGALTVPYSLQTRSGSKGVDQAGRFPSGTRLTGRVGDFNGDGWIDGTLVAVGVLPLDAPIYPGQPYVIERNFETDIPIDGATFADVRSLRPTGQVSR